MKRSILLSLCAFSLLSACQDTHPTTDMQTQENAPPIADRKDSLLEAHGNTRVDPYFWMRLTDQQKTATDPDIQTKKVVQYLEDENTYTSEVMKPTDSLQQKLFEEMTGRIQKDDASVPYLKNGYWYYTRFEEAQEYPIYCRKKGSLDGAESVILNVNQLAQGYDYYAVGGIRISKDNNILAYAVDTLSRRVYTYKFLNLETGELLNDEITNTEPGGAWSNDNLTFYYTTKNDVTLLSEKIWRHQLKTDQKEDIMMYHEQDPSFYISVKKSKSDDYIVISCRSTLIKDYHILSAHEPTGTFRQFTPRNGPHEYSIEHFKDKFYVLTNWEAQNFRLMETSQEATHLENWSTLIPNNPDTLLSSIQVFSEHLVISQRSNALTSLKVIHQKTGNHHEVSFDEPAYVVYPTTNTEFNTTKLRFIYASLTTPNTTFEYDMNERSKTILKETQVMGGHEPSKYTTERLFAEGRDGTQIPISLVYKKGLVKSDQNPLLLYAYGSYGNSTDPWFNSIRLSLLDRGFIYAIAHVRGGQEMGRKWYEEGRMFKKKNTFYDFIDCASYLSNEGYSSAEHLYAQGGSAGGLLMGAVINMAPERFNGVIAAVPFVDVISTMMDESIPLTTAEFNEWGNPKNLESYEYMHSYSPYDQVRAQAYPNLLVTTGYFDSQVQYWEPAKWVAKLRSYKTDENLLLLQTNMAAGHGGASGRYRRYENVALQYAFLLSLEDINE